MLSKKILLLKKKIKEKEEKILSVLFKDVFDKLQEQSKEIDALKKKLSTFEQSFDIELESINDSVNKTVNICEEFDDYRITCSKDITVLASSITEIYNVINFIVGGKLIKQKQSVDSSVIFGEDINEEELEDDLYEIKF
jgi:hypothetical protein